VIIVILSRFRIVMNSIPEFIDMIPANIKPDALIALCREHPHLLDQYRVSDPEFAALIASGDVLKLRAAMMKRIMMNVPKPLPQQASIHQPVSMPIPSPSASNLFPRIQLIEHIGPMKPEQLIQICSEQPHLLQQFLSQDPDVGNCIASKDIPRLRTIMMTRELNRSKRQFDNSREMDLLESDPNNEEYQKKIAERIRLENVTENRNFAIENFPESFGTISMLYVNIEINSVPIKAFVDSGAQSTIMSRSCAERCNVMKLLDTMYAGQAVGIGSAKILGRIHLTQMKFGNTFFPVSITVLDSEGVDFLLGLDMLRRYRSNIDLFNNVLRFGIGDGFEEVRFLGESDIPAMKGFKEALPADDSSKSVTDNRDNEDFNDKVPELMSLGFSHEQASLALIEAKGSVELAASLLLNRSNR
jgi:hypothetical protein